MENTSVAGVCKRCFMFRLICIIRPIYLAKRKDESASALMLLTVFFHVFRVFFLVWLDVVGNGSPIFTAKQSKAKELVERIQIWSKFTNSFTFTHCKVWLHPPLLAASISGEHTNEISTENTQWSINRKYRINSLWSFTRISTVSYLLLNFLDQKVCHKSISPFRTLP